MFYWSEPTIEPTLWLFIEILENKQKIVQKKSISPIFFITIWTEIRELIELIDVIQNIRKFLITFVIIKSLSVEVFDKTNIIWFNHKIAINTNNDLMIKINI